MTPPIHGLTVCVNYSAYLTHSIARWMLGCQSLIVVTTREDTDTVLLCEQVNRSYLQHYGRSYDLTVHITDAFTRDGAAFNKGRAMEESRELMVWQDWILFFDADIVPEMVWEERLGELQMGFLYGAKRQQAPSPIYIDSPCPPMDDDRIGYGYFQLFHSADPKVQKRPLLDTHWRHAGNADSNFLLSFRNMVKELPITLWHLGGKHENWFGVGREQEFKRMQERRGGHGIHPSERLP